MNPLFRAGLVILAALAIIDLPTPFVTDGEHPPMAVAVVSVVLGAVSLACLPGAWRGRKPALLGLFGTRLLSAALAMPAFFVGDVPSAVVVFVAGFVAVTVIGVVLSLAGTHRTVTA